MSQGKEPQGRRELRHWHVIFGIFLEKRLRPANIEVAVEVMAAKTLPAIDIMVSLPSDQVVWEEAQLARLPDGLRSCGASKIVIEFKYSESFGAEAITQALVYDWLYRGQKDLGKKDVKAFVVCSKTPNSRRLAEHGYVSSGLPGVFHSSHPLERRVDVISLNELSDEPHNLEFKLFASKRRVRVQTLEKLMAAPTLTDEARYFLTTLRLAFSEKGADSMITSMTEEEILDFGKKLTHMSLRYASYKDRLEGIPAQERMRDIPVQERMRDIPVQERMRDIPVQERMRDIPVQERMRDIPVQERMRDIPVEERLEGVSKDELLKILTRLTQSES